MVKKRVKQLGELGLIAQIRRESTARPGQFVRLGIGDDCAILRPPAGHEVLVTTDLLLEGRHFRQDWHSPESVGHRCLARGLSDLAAMGAMPIAAFLSLALPPGTKKAWVDGFFRGLQRLAKRYEVPLAGGDMAESLAGIVADIVLVGTAPTGRALRRAGAQRGDVLYVTGTLGGAAAELERMRSGRVRKVRNGAGRDHPQMFPEPRLDIGKVLLKRRLATACIDVSDGLSTDLAHLCQESGTGAELLQAALPIEGRATLRQALDGGEDYELLFTADAKVRLPKRIAGVALTAIGRMTSARTGMLLVRPDGTRGKLVARGWEHFRS